MKPVKGENAPMAINSTSESCREFSVTYGINLAFSIHDWRCWSSITRLINLPPCGRINSLFMIFYYYPQIIHMLCCDKVESYSRPAHVLKLRMELSSLRASPE